MRLGSGMRADICGEMRKDQRMVKLSLCVPIYGVEKEIPRFLSSLEKNLHPDIEVLLIDDGAKDNSGKIADDFAAKHSDIVRMIHKPNGGLSSARNKGLELARGEYVIFPDPDDILTDDYVSTILDAIDKYDAPDMILFDYYTGEKLSKMKRKTVNAFREGMVQKESFIREFVKDKDVKSYVWNKAIKRSLYEGRTFDIQIRVAEDFALLTDMVLQMESFAYIPKPLYYYMIRPSSLCRTARLSDSLRFYELTRDRYRKYSLLYSGVSKYKPVSCVYDVLRKMYLTDDMNDTSRFERVVKDNIGYVLFDRDFRINEKKRAIFIWLGIGRMYNRLKYKEHQ